MSPADLAQRLAELDWSATSLQHQLAISAAVETLGGKALAIPYPFQSGDPRFDGADSFECHQTFPIVATESITHDSGAITHDPLNAEAELSLPNVVQLPVRKLNRWTTLFQLDGREWSSSTHFTGPGDAWAWVGETVAHEHGVSEDQVSSFEGSEDQYDGDDLVTIDGIAVYRLRHVCK